LAGFFGGAIFDELDPEHQAFAADIPNDLVLRFQLLEAGQDVITELKGVLLQVIFFDYFEDGFAHAQTTGLPPKVLKWIFCVRTLAIWGVVTTAASGAPFPMPLAW